MVIIVLPFSIQRSTVGDTLGDTDSGDNSASKTILITNGAIMKKRYLFGTRDNIFNSAAVSI